MEYLRIWYSSIEAVDELDDVEAGRLLKALLHYGRDGTMPSLPGAERIAFKMLKPMIDNEAASYEKKCGTLRANGMKGGRPKKAVGIDQSETEANGSSENQMVSGENQLVSEKTNCAQVKLSYVKLSNDVVGGVEGLAQERTLSNVVSLELTGMSEGNWQELNDMLEEGNIPNEVAIHAIDYTVAHGARTWAYVRKVLHSYIANKVHTIQEAIALEERRQQPVRSQPKPVVNPWLDMVNAEVK